MLRAVLKSAAKTGAAFAIALVVLSQGINAPFVKDAEPQSAEWIESVAGRGPILVPRDYYGEMDRKPPLFYWLSGELARRTDRPVNEAMARAVSVGAGAAVAAEVMLWAGANLGTAAGWLGFAFLLGSYGFASRATLALTDMLMTFWLFSAWMLLVPELDGRHRAGRVAAAGAILGLGILTKGPVVLMLAALAAAIYLALSRKSPFAALRRAWPWQILVIAAAVGACWYVPALVANGRRLALIVLQENFGHFMPAAMGGTGEASRPLYYIAVKIFVQTLPSSLLLPALAVALWRGETVVSARAPLLAQLSLALSVLLLFSVASAKRDDYILPAIPSLAIALGTMATSLRPRASAVRGWTEWLRDTAYCVAAAAFVTTVVAAWIWVRIGGDALALLHLATVDRATIRIFLGYAAQVRMPFLAFAAATVLGMGAIAAGVQVGRGDVGGGGMAILAIIGVLVITASIRPRLNRMRTLKYAAASVRQIAGDAPLYVVHAPNYELSYYYGRAPRPIVAGRDPVRLPLHSQVYVLAYPGEIPLLDHALGPRLQQTAEFPVLGSVGSPVLYRVAPAAEGLKADAAKDK